MKSKLLTTVTIFFLFFQSNLFANEVISINNVNEDNIADVYEEVIRFLNLEHKLEGGHGTLEMRWVKHKLDSLLGIMAISTSINPSGNPCDGGPFSPASQLNGEFYNVEFNWVQNLPEVLQYSAYYLDLDISSGIIDQSDVNSFNNGESPTLSLVVPRTGKHLFAINTRCATEQSSYTIIIAEKIITSPTTYFGELEANPEPNLRIKKPEDKPTLAILPNLVESETQIKFQLFEDDNTTISLYNGNTGAQIKEVFSSKGLREGTYSIYLETNDLAPGVYFIIMYTNHQRIIRRMVKV